MVQPYPVDPEQQPGMIRGLGDVGGMFRGLGRGFRGGANALNPYSNRLLAFGAGMLSGGPAGAAKGMMVGGELDREAADRRRQDEAMQGLMGQEGGLLAEFSEPERAYLAANPDALNAVIGARMKQHDPVDAYGFTEVDGVLVRYNKHTGEVDPSYQSPTAGQPDPKQAFERERQLRGDATSDPQFKRFQEAVPVYQSMVETGGANTKFSDLNLVYGLAKIMDPTSVVREGEQIMVRDASGLSESIIGQINALNGGAALTPATREALMKEAKSRMTEYRRAAAQQQGFFGGVADEYKIPRGRVIPPLQDLGEFEPGDMPFTEEP